ncbi:MAG: glycosyltransferase family 39 protein [Sedimentisphaerales bacterium]|nr:glycosyltransferase family 39 protein [Sedimentisphaerales bacterium]
MNPAASNPERIGLDGSAYRPLPQWLVAVLLGLIVMAGKAPTLGLPYHWDEAGAYVGPARWLAEGSLLRALPGGHPPGKLFGHPPGLYLTLAGLYKLFGPAPIVSHLFMAVLAFVALWYTYRIGDWLWDQTTGVLGALFLWAMPLFFAQAGMALGDLPITAFGLMTVYYGLRGRLLSYLLCGIYLVLLKETALATVAAVILYRLICDRSRRRRPGLILLWCIPVAVLAAFFGWQKIATGEAFGNPYFQEHKLLADTPGAMVRQTALMLYILFIQQHRWLLGVVIAAGLIRRRDCLHRRPLILFVLVLALGGLPFCSLYFMPRYILPLLPFYALAAAGGLTGPSRSACGRFAVALLILTAFGTRLYGSRGGYSNFEMDLQYVDMIRLHQRTADYVQKYHPQATVWAPWPVSQLLRESWLGYVRRPLQVTDQPDASDLLIYIDRPAEGTDIIKKDYLQTGRATFLGRIEQNRKWLELYLSKPRRTPYNTETKRP